MSARQQPLMQARTALAISAFVAHPAHAVVLYGLHGSGKGTVAAYLATQLGGILSQYQSDQKDFGVEQVRELIAHAKYKTKHARSVFILEHADSLGTESQNTLLKIIEEPPEGTYFILTANQLQGLLPTIRSRSAQIEIAAPPSNQLQQHFEALGYPSDVVAKAVAKAANLPGLVAAFLENTAHPFNDALEQVKAFMAATAVGRLTLASQIVQDKQQALTFANALVHTSQIALEHAARSSKPDVLARWKKTAEAALYLQQALSVNANTKLAFDDLCLQL